MSGNLWSARHAMMQEAGLDALGIDGLRITPIGANDPKMSPNRGFPGVNSTLGSAKTIAFLLPSIASHSRHDKQHFPPPRGLWRGSGGKAQRGREKDVTKLSQNTRSDQAERQRRVRQTYSFDVDHRGASSYQPAEATVNLKKNKNKEKGKSYMAML